MAVPAGTRAARLDEPTPNKQYGYTACGDAQCGAAGGGERLARGLPAARVLQ